MLSKRTQIEINFPIIEITKNRYCFYFDTNFAIEFTPVYFVYKSFHNKRIVKGFSAIFLDICLFGFGFTLSTVIKL